MDLSISNRITLIKRIGNAMQEETLADLDLTLDTFGIPGAPTPQGYGDENYEYVLRRMKQAPDEVVVGVHAHLYPDAQAEIGSAAVEPQPDGPWADETFRLFLSHTDENKVLAGQIRTRLADYGIDAYVAHDNIKPTSEWQNDIEAALKTCDALAAILTPDFLHSKWCDQRWGPCSDATAASSESSRERCRTASSPSTRPSAGTPQISPRGSSRNVSSARFGSMHRPDLE